MPGARSTTTFLITCSSPRHDTRLTLFGHTAEYDRYAAMNGCVAQLPITASWDVDEAFARLANLSRTEVATHEAELQSLASGSGSGLADAG
jgi:hypothetical protein